MCFRKGSRSTQATRFKVELLSVEKVWGTAPHSAFGDVIRFGDRWWCTFREAKTHWESIGAVRVITSSDAKNWDSAALLSEPEIDLRDPKLSITPDGRLMLLMGGCVLAPDGTYLTRSPRVMFSIDGHNWTKSRRLLSEDHWLWRAIWHDGIAYSLSKLGEGSEPRRGFLYSSNDALEWDWITEFKVDGVSETTLRIMPDGEMIALIRPGYVGSSTYPYTKWSYFQLADQMIGGPNFIRLPDGRLLAGARRYSVDGADMALAWMTKDSDEWVCKLPRGGDCSYPGFVWYNDLLWVTYYSSHEGKAQIYLATVDVG